MSAERVRVGVAFTAPTGDTRRRNQYGLVRLSGSTQVYAKYEGYREVRGGAEWQTGLPLAGPFADHLQILIPFVEMQFAEVRFFEAAS